MTGRCVTVVQKAIDLNIEHHVSKSETKAVPIVFGVAVSFDRFDAVSTLRLSGANEQDCFARVTKHCLSYIW